MQHGDYVRIIRRVLLSIVGVFNHVHAAMRFFQEFWQGVFAQNISGARNARFELNEEDKINFISAVHESYVLNRCSLDI